MVSTPLKNMKVSWDYDIPNIWKKHVPNHQPGLLRFIKNNKQTSLEGPVYNTSL